MRSPKVLWFTVFCIVGIAFGSGAGRPARAQIVNPADKQKEVERSQSTEKEPAAEGGLLHSWQLPPINIVGQRPAKLHEEDRVGPNAQPRWTASRRFAETRVYVLPPGTFEFEYWLVPEVPRDGPTEITKQYEVEIGLPNRIQLDLYVVSGQSGNRGPLQFGEEKLELRWALAEWGRLPGNPTFYLEWAAIGDEPDRLEGKVLLGGGIAPRWHWGANLVLEHQMGELMEESKELTLGASYALLDQKFSLGGETKYALLDTNAKRGSYQTEFLVGPSFQYRPIPQAHLDVAGLFGVTHDSPKAKPIIVFGWEF